MKRPIAVAVLLAVLLAGCGAPPSVEAPAASPESAARADTEWELTDTAAGDYSLRELGLYAALAEQHSGEYSVRVLDAGSGLLLYALERDIPKEPMAQPVFASETAEVGVYDVAGDKISFAFAPPERMYCTSGALAGTASVGYVCGAMLAGEPQRCGVFRLDGDGAELLEAQEYYGYCPEVASNAGYVVCAWSEYPADGGKSQMLFSVTGDGLMPVAGLSGTLSGLCADEQRFLVRDGEGLVCFTPDGSTQSLTLPVGWRIDSFCLLDDWAAVSLSNSEQRHRLCLLPLDGGEAVASAGGTALYRMTRLDSARFFAVDMSYQIYIISVGGGEFLRAPVDCSEYVPSGGGVLAVEYMGNSVLLNFTQERVLLELAGRAQLWEPQEDGVNSFGGIRGVVYRYTDIGGLGGEAAFRDMLTQLLEDCKQPEEGRSFTLKSYAIGAVSVIDKTGLEAMSSADGRPLVDPRFFAEDQYLVNAGVSFTWEGSYGALGAPLEPDFLGDDRLSSNGWIMQKNGNEYAMTAFDGWYVDLFDAE